MSLEVCAAAGGSIYGTNIDIYIYTNAIRISKLGEQSIFSSDRASGAIINGIPSSETILKSIFFV